MSGKMSYADVMARKKSQSNYFTKLVLGWCFGLVLLALLAGCTPKPTQMRNDADDCFKAGGTEYQQGLSGGRFHSVCVYKNCYGTCGSK
jgi:hypothetical protein